MADVGGIRAGRAFVELGVEGLEKVQANLAAFGDMVKAIGTTLALGFAVNKVTGFADSFAEGAKDVFLMSRQLQMTTDQYQEMTSAAKALGIGNEQMAAAVERSRHFVAELALSGQQTNEVMQQLGLTLNDVAGLSDLERVQRFGEALKRLNPADVSLFGRRIFGRGGEAIAAVASDIGDAAAKARGKGWTPEQIQQGYELARATEKFHSALEDVGKTIGAILAPGFTTIYQTMTKILKSVAEWIEEHEDLVKQIAVAGGLTVGLSAALIAVSSVSSAIGFVWAGISTIIGAVTGLIGLMLSPVTLIVAAVAGIGYYFLKDTELAKNLGESVADLGDTFSATFGAVAEALEAGEIGLAWDVLVAGMKVAWYQFNNILHESLGVDLIDIFLTLRQVWAETVAFMRSVWAGATTAIRVTGESIGTGLANSFMRNFGNMLGFSEDVIRTTIGQNNAAQNQANREALDALAANLASIESDRLQATNRINADRANRSQDQQNAQIELDNAIEAASIAAAQRREELQNRINRIQSNSAPLATQIAGIANGTFNRDAIGGMGGAVFQKIADRAQEQVDKLTEVVDGLVRLDDAIDGLQLRVS